MAGREPSEIIRQVRACICPARERHFTDDEKILYIAETSGIAEKRYEHWSGARDPHDGVHRGIDTR